MSHPADCLCPFCADDVLSSLGRYGPFERGANTMWTKDIGKSGAPKAMKKPPGDKITSAEKKVKDQVLVRRGDLPLSKLKKKPVNNSGTD